jgi:hypothetical protein
LPFICTLYTFCVVHRRTRPGWIRSWGSGLNCRWLKTWETTCKTVSLSPSWLKSSVSVLSFYFLPSFFADLVDSLVVFTVQWLWKFKNKKELLKVWWTRL